MIRSERIIQIDANANAKGGMDYIITPKKYSTYKHRAITPKLFSVQVNRFYLLSLLRILLNV